ncbi:MAG: hypothetical protein R3D51_18615 [Hyphomicrobiaceae bacterium]
MSRVGHANYETASAELRAAWDSEMRERGRVTNMKRTLLQSEPAYAAYMGWYPLWDELEKLVGHRAAAVFAHAISARNGCVLCTLYFRKELDEVGIAPDAFTTTPDEALLVRLAESMVVESAGHHTSDNEALWKDLKARFSDRDLVNIVGFAGMMMAVNVFNSTLGVEVDKELERFLPSLRTAQRQAANETT